MAKRWTESEEQALLQGIGVYGIAWFRKNSGNSYDWPNALQGRTADACYSKARRMFGGGGLTRGSYSIEKIIRITGYSKTQIRRAMRALMQKWKRLSPTGSYLIYEEQFQDLVEWLSDDYWAPLHRLYNCLWCHSKKIRHEGKGLCLKCYRRYVKQLHRNELPSDNQSLMELVKEYCSDLRDFEKIEKQLNRKRALPEHVMRVLIERMKNDV